MWNVSGVSYRLCRPSPARAELVKRAQTPPNRPSRSTKLSAKKSFDLGAEILDVIEGGPKLRRWSVIFPASHHLHPTYL